MKRCRTIPNRVSKGFTLLEVVISMFILAILAGAVYAVVSSSISASETAMTQQLILRRLDAFLRVTRDAFLNLPATGTVTLEIGKSTDGSTEQRLVIAKPQGIFGLPSLAGGSLVLVARARADGTRTMTMLTIPAKVTDRERADALAAHGIPLLPKILKPRWSFKTSPQDEQWKLELPTGSPRPILIRLQFEINDLPNPVDTVFYLPPVSLPPPTSDEAATNAPAPTPVP
jgi:prepilin-type N-terminal cleavage/methylation domain-containing protein